MTGTLHVRLQKYLMDDRVENAAVATITALSSAGGRRSRSKPQQVVIPAGTSEALQVELDPGRYLVEATLPSGELVSDQVEVINKKRATVELRPDESPHEWLSWQQFMGKVERIERYGPTDGVFELVEPKVHWVTDPDPSLRGDRPGDAWALIAGLDQAGQSAGHLAAMPPERVEPFMSDSQSRLYQLTARGPWNEWRLPTSRGAPPTPRRYLIIEIEGVSHLVCLPVPWISLTTRRDIPVQILVRKRAADEDTVISVTVRDPQIGPALGFMTQGALPTAERLFSQAREMLFMKHTNPLGAAAGGYVLLGTESGSEPKAWHQWIRNLMNRFAWLPDGAIQYGWLKLRHRTSAEDRNEARDAFFTAYHRGLPFCSAGLQWLIEGLTLFAAQDRDAAGMLENVHRVAWHVNLQEPFTIVRLPFP